MNGFFAVRYRPGPAWVEGRSIFEQDLDAHVEHLRRLHERGRLLAAGPLSDSEGGVALLQALDAEEAETLVRADPDVERGVITAEIHPWAPIAWDRLPTHPVPYEFPPLTTHREVEPAPRGEA